MNRIDSGAAPHKPQNLRSGRGGNRNFLFCYQPEYVSVISSLQDSDTLGAHRSNPVLKSLHADPYSHGRFVNKAAERDSKSTSSHTCSRSRHNLAYILSSIRFFSRHSTVASAISGFLSCNFGIWGSPEPLERSVRSETTPRP